MALIDNLDPEIIYGISQKKALAVFNSIYVDIPEAEREQKNQELRDMLKKWLEEDADKHH